MAAKHFIGGYYQISRALKFGPALCSTRSRQPKKHNGERDAIDHSEGALQLDAAMGLVEDIDSIWAMCSPGPYRDIGSKMPMKRSQLKRGNSQLKRTRMKDGRKRMKFRSNPEEGSIKALEQQLDDLTRRVVRLHEMTCFTDGQRGTLDDPLELSHLFGRAQRPTRFDVHPEGGNHMQHRSCNQRHNDDKSIYQDEYIRRYGNEAFEELEFRAHSNQVFTWLELHRMILQREAMLA